MSETTRPNPDALLKVANESESKSGALTIFFGAAPGVGKTYAMLEEARHRKDDGCDVVVGYVEPHKRKDTEALLEGLEIIPACAITYKGIALHEADLDAILARKPLIVLMDELAHTNAPGSRHEKRFQDIEEILGAGIDVYTTLNVQHLESTKDIVSGITGIQVKETVPDGIFLNAKEVKIIDLTPAALLRRLAEGKVYVGDMAKRAVEKFFTVENLTALRELALRGMASSVNKEVDEYRRLKAVKEPWPTADKILVGLFSSPSAERLVRSAFRFASELNAKWTALHVVTDRDSFLAEEERAWLSKAVNLAKELGADVVIAKGQDAADEIIRYAQDHNVTKIILGKPSRLRTSLFFTWKILKGTRGIDVFWFSHEFKTGAYNIKKRFSGLGDILRGCVWVALTAGIGQVLREVLTETNMLFLMMLPVVITAIKFKRRAAVISALLSILLFDYLFVKPYYTFAVNDFQYFLSFVTVALIAFFVSDLASKMRFQVGELRRSESQNAAMLDLAKDLLTARDADYAAYFLIKHIRKRVPSEAIVFIYGDKGETVLEKLSPGFVLDDKESAVASWVRKNGEPAGPGTKTLREAKAMYFPVRSGNATKIVIGLQFHVNNYILTAEDQTFIETIARLAALVLGEKRASRL